MTPVTRDTLKRIMQEFPTVAWHDRELDELVSPTFGVITGFQQLLDNIDALMRTDLADLPMAGPLRRGTGNR
jgi:hypothetical protein